MYDMTREGEYFMKNLYLKIISSAIIITSVLVVLTCSFETDPPGMVWIPPGTFNMGSPYGEPGRNEITGVEDQHQVTLTRGFWMSKYEITQEQFFLIMGQEPANPAFGDRHPADGVNWYAAIVFCNKLSIKEGLRPVYSMPAYDDSPDPDFWIQSNGGIIPNETYKNPAWDNVTPDWNANGYRLPTEAEWEYACRAGATTAFNWGTNYITTDQANFNPVEYYNGIPTGGIYRAETTMVGSFAPNAWGLYDMHGNVFEWCWDWYVYYSGDESDPFGPPSGVRRLLRSGGYKTEARNVRSAFRSDYGYPFERGEATGFRVVRN